MNFELIYRQAYGSISKSLIIRLYLIEDERENLYYIIISYIELRY